MKVNKFLKGIAITAVSTLVLVGCSGNSEENDGTTGPSPSSSPTASPTETVTSVELGDNDLAEIADLFVEQVNILTKQRDDIEPLQAITLDSSQEEIQGAIVQVVPNLADVYLVTNEYNKAAFLNLMGFRITSYHFAEGVDRSGYNPGDITIDAELVSTYVDIPNSVAIPPRALLIEGEEQLEEGVPTVVTKSDGKWLINVDSQFASYEEAEVVSVGSDALVTWTDFNASLNDQ